MCVTSAPISQDSTRRKTRWPPIRPPPPRGSRWQFINLDGLDNNIVCNDFLFLKKKCPYRFQKCRILYPFSCWKHSWEFPLWLKAGLLPVLKTKVSFFWDPSQDMSSSSFLPKNRPLIGRPDRLLIRGLFFCGKPLSNSCRPVSYLDCKATSF